MKCSILILALIFISAKIACLGLAQAASVSGASKRPATSDVQIPSFDIDFDASDMLERLTSNTQVQPQLAPQACHSFAKDVNVGNCSVHIHGHACVHCKRLHCKTEYQAWAATCGAEGYSGWQGDPEFASKLAIVVLFQGLWCDCNTIVKSSSLGKCTFQASISWFFQNVDDLNNKHPVLRAVVKEEHSGQQGTSCCFNADEAGGQQAATAAFNDLAKRFNVSSCSDSSEPLRS